MNDVDKLLRPKVHYCMIGPVPLFAVVEVLGQLEEQEWYVRFLSFAGMGAPQLTIPGQNMAVPLYMMVACKEEEAGHPVELPKIDLSGRKK